MLNTAMTTKLSFLLIAALMMMAAAGSTAQQAAVATDEQPTAPQVLDVPALPY